MQTYSRNREQLDPRSFAARKGHLPQLSISDDNHHVTEAIGYMYGDDESPSSPQSPGRYTTRSDRQESETMNMTGRRNSLPRKPLTDYKPSVTDRISPLMETQPRMQTPYRNGWDEKKGVSPVSPLSTRESSPAETANTPFPLNDIDYESSPAAVAQELSNLQALRRMSMDVAATGDPDLPQLNLAAMPSAPSPTTSEDDSARLFWVPARLHPELAPKEFKSFLESKAEQIKRRSGELSAFSSPIASSRPSSLSSTDSNSGLRRKKSMLSRQIDSSTGYEDGADRLELKKAGGPNGHSSDPNLQELGSLVSSSQSLPRISLEGRSSEETPDVILPSVPGSSLKRSTRTKYQRPESRKGPVDRSTYAERAKRRAGVSGSGDESPITPTITLVPSEPPLPGFSPDVTNLASTLRDPSSESYRSTTNFSRPGNRSPSPPPKDSLPTTFDSIFPSVNNDHHTNGSSNYKSKTGRNSNALPAPPLSERPIPQIVESPPPEDHPVRTSSMAPPPSNVYHIKSEPPKPVEPSRDARSKNAPPQRPGMVGKTSSTVTSNRPSSRGSNMPPQTPPIQGLDQPSPLPGHDTNTSNLSYIPTLGVDKRQEQRKREEKKSGWSWLLGKEESDKDKDRSKGKAPKSSQSHDSTRLDVLQTSIDGGPKGRESLVLDRESLKLEEERKKESMRKSSGSEKKEKESIFSTIFGSKRNKAEKDALRKAQERLSPEPRHREMKPDIDYNWTRFSILEERAIYRMAHIKLANPRRALYSQVLLSNFMYSYLAKVQQMHPQMNLPTSAKQQRKQKELQQQQHQQHHQQQQQQQPDEYTQYQRYQQQQDQNATPVQNTAGHADSRQGFDNGSNMYDYNYSRGGQHSAESSSSATGHSEHHLEGSGGSNPYAIGGSPQYHQQPQQQRTSSQRQRQRRGADYKYDDDDDDDDDMCSMSRTTPNSTPVTKPSEPGAIDEDQFRETTTSTTSESRAQPASEPQRITTSTARMISTRNNAGLGAGIYRKSSN